MTILITGATGLIGKALTKVCLSRGFTVHYLTTRQNAVVTEEKKKGFLWNPSKNEIDVNAFNGVSTIVHLAGATVANRWTSAYKKEILESRINTAQVIYDALEAIEHNVVHFISASGVSIYPPSFTKLYTESSTDVSDDFLGTVVTTWEKAADTFSNLDIQVAKVRTGVVFSAEEGAYPKIEKPVKMNLGAALGSGKQYLSWIHLDDIVGIYDYIIINKLEGVYNGVAPTPIKNATLTKKIAERYHKKIWLPNVPSFVLNIAMGEMSTLVLDGQLVSPAKMQKTKYMFMHSNIDSALNQLISNKKDS
ncbi:possible sugar nucleotide epimerase [unidentified eubacterium SCB49]|nr:possible sugar nucleotide epimerase [unidentified eubacterium SCB49]